MLGNIQDELPSNFDQAAPYLREGLASLAGNKEFEMVYQGSINELTNVLLKAVSLIRERQAWPTPDGKWAKIYVMADGWATIVESDDNFQSWEAAHVLSAAVLHCPIIASETQC